MEHGEGSVEERHSVDEHAAACDGEAVDDDAHQLAVLRRGVNLARGGCKLQRAEASEAIRQADEDDWLRGDATSSRPPNDGRLHALCPRCQGEGDITEDNGIEHANPQWGSGGAVKARADLKECAALQVCANCSRWGGTIVPCEREGIGVTDSADLSNMQRSTRGRRWGLHVAVEAEL